MIRQPIHKRKRLGEILVQKGLLTPDELAETLRDQKQAGKPLGQLLMEKQVITDEALAEILAEQMGIPHVWLRKGLVDPRVVPLIPKDKAKFFQVIPMFRIRKTLILATADPHAVFVFDEVAKITGLDVRPVLCRAEDIDAAIDEYHREDVNFEEVAAGIEEQDIELLQGPQEKEVTEIAKLAEGSPVVNLANMILVKSIRDGASDIHIEPGRNKFRVRVRIDGVLYELMTPRIEMHPGVVSRLKVMANLDIAERRMPQDGRIQVSVDNQQIDLRFSSMPGIHGEKVVLRILDQRKAILDINRLGIAHKALETFKGLLRRPHGLLLVCGPTGSGKTTTLYSALSIFNALEKNIVTIEDPVEYQMENINQNQVNEGIGLSFARFLKHALRQDPDVILVGEIRDQATAEIAIQASLTGHLVLSTLHTNDSPSAVTRLLEMNVEPYLISSALLASISQRLVRAVCPKCKTYYVPPEEVLRELAERGHKPAKLAKGRGCKECYDSGFKGRTGIYEFLEVDEGLRSLILKNPTADMIYQHSSKNGFRPMREHGYEKVIQELTTLEEIKRVTSVDI